MAKINIFQRLNSKPPKNERFYTIVIDGRGGAGKSYLVDYLKDVLRDFIFIDGDDYFEPVNNQAAWGAFNDQRFISDVINPLQKGNTFNYRPYRWGKEPHIIEKMVTVKSGICIHRCFAFRFNLDWDLKIWIETPKEVCLQRGIEHDSLMPKERVLRVWRDIWQPQDDRYIAETKPQEIADIVLDGARPFKEQIT